MCRSFSSNCNNMSLERRRRRRRRRWWEKANKSNGAIMRELHSSKPYRWVITIDRWLMKWRNTLGPTDRHRSTHAIRRMSWLPAHARRFLCLQKRVRRATWTFSNYVAIRRATLPNHASARSREENFVALGTRTSAAKNILLTCRCECRWWWWWWCFRRDLAPVVVDVEFIEDKDGMSYSYWLMLS